MENLNAVFAASLKTVCATRGRSPAPEKIQALYNSIQAAGYEPVSTLRLLAGKTGQVINEKRLALFNLGTIRQDAPESRELSFTEMLNNQMNTTPAPVVETPVFPSAGEKAVVHSDPVLVCGESKLWAQVLQYHYDTKTGPSLGVKKVYLFVVWHGKSGKSGRTVVGRIPLTAVQATLNPDLWKRLGL